MVCLSVRDTQWFPMLRLHLVLGSCLSSDKNKKYGTAADSPSCVLNEVKSSLGKNCRLLRRKIYVSTLMLCIGVQTFVKTYALI